MKFYEVACPVHGTFEVSSSENVCPGLCPITENGKPCGEHLKRIWNKPAVHYKGSGFYNTDNK